MATAQSASPAPALSPRRNQVAHAWLTSPVYTQLKLEADRRGEHVDTLTASIVNAVVLGGYVDVMLELLASG